MENINDYINSGILEFYVMGITTDEENKEIQRLALHYPIVKTEIENITQALAAYLNVGRMAPGGHIKKRLFSQLGNG